MRQQPGFIIYNTSFDFVEDIETMEDRGKLLTALFRYSKYGELPDFIQGTLLSAVFKSMRINIDLNNEKYEKRCEQNSENINKRWAKVFIENKELTEKQFNEKYQNGYWIPELQLSFMTFEECYNHQKELSSEEIREQFKCGFELDNKIKKAFKK